MLGPDRTAQLEWRAALSIGTGRANRKLKNQVESKYSIEYIVRNDPMFSFALS